MDCVIGIDPGAKGSIGIINAKDGSFIAQYDMPILAGELDVIEFYTILQVHIKDALLICLEHTQYTPVIKGKGAFTFGRVTGATKAVVCMMKNKFTSVRPQEWKKEFSLIKKGKEYSISKAIELFPEQRKLLNFKTKDGRSESLLIAEWGRRKLIQ